MRVIIDRFEGEFAVCEVSDEERMINLPLKDLPEGAKPGDVLKISDGGITIDNEETADRKKRINNLLDSLWE
jgi:hypothetical protein